MKIRVTIESMPDTPFGVPNGRTIYHVMASMPHLIEMPNQVEMLGRGCVLGRDYSAEAAIQDFVRRARADGGKVKREDIEVI